MQKIIVKKDIYNTKGVLIVPKDTCIQLSESMKTRLEKLGVLKKILSEEQTNHTTEIIERDEFEDKVSNFKEKHLVSENKLLSDAIDIVQNLIFNSKEHKWHLCLHTLINHDELLYSHSLDTALLTALIGAKLKFSEESLNDLVLGALFHDIGLILTPFTIIQKSEHLSKEEEILYKNHCNLGCSMVTNIIDSPIVKNIILQHHERLDGSGYPNNLIYNEISLYAQIVMVAETFNSATLHTPYKNEKDPKSVIKEMLENKHKFPERIVKCLKEIIS